MRIAILGIAGLAGLLAGCGGAEDTPEACRYAVAQAIDQRDYDKALTKIDSCPDAYTAEERILTLGAIYVGKAGYDIPTLVNDMTSVDQDSADSYQAFIDVLGKRASGASLNHLNTALGYYRQMLGGQDDVGKYCTDNKPNLTSLQKEACFNAGLVQAAQSANSLALLFNGNTSGWGTPGGCPETGGNDANSNGTSDEAEVAACGIRYAVNGTTACADGVSVESPFLPNYKSFVTSAGRSGTYEEIRVTVAPVAPCATPGVHYRPVTVDAPAGEERSPVLTDGLCLADIGTYGACSQVDGASCLPCPVINAEGDVTVAATVIGTVVNALNTGESALLSSVSSDEDSDVEQSMQDFKTEACGADGVCTQTDIADYLSQ